MNSIPSTATSGADEPAMAGSVPGSAAPPVGSDSLGSEVRESLLLLSFAAAVTVGLTTVAQAALAVLA